MDLTDEQWLLIAPLFPPPNPSHRGRPTLDPRCVFNGIFWKLSTHSNWYDLPPRYPSHQSCYRFYCQWLRSGVLIKIFEALELDLRNRGGLDLKSQFKKGIITVIEDTPAWFFKAPLELIGTWQLTTAYFLLFLSLDLYKNKYPLIEIPI